MKTNKSPSKPSQSYKRRGIVAFSVSGYKSICQDQTIELRPLTLLAGTNSSGKSSIMQPLLLIKQTLEAPFDPGALLLDGPNVRITSTEQLICRMGGPCPDVFSVSFEIAGAKVSGDGVLNVSFKRVPGVGIQIESMGHIESKGIETKMRLGMTNEDIMSKLPAPLKKLGDQIEKSEKKELQWDIRRDRCFLYFDLRIPGWPSHRSMIGGGFSPASLVGPSLEGIIHLPGLRGNPERTYKTTAVGQSFPGTFENYIASIINHWQTAKDDKLKQLGKFLEALGLTWKVEARPVDDTRVELRVGRMPHSKRGGAHDMVSIADVGFGVSQTLPVLVALLTAKPGQIVYLEQPEIHLHPKAQKQMAGVLADAALRGVIVVVETHSSILLRGIQILVAKGKLPASLTKLHWFQRDDNGATRVTTAELDDFGSFGNWPEDFDETSLDAEMEYLDAVEQGSMLS